jgi:hypothetical protein
LASSTHDSEDKNIKDNEKRAPPRKKANISREDYEE